MTIEPEAIVHTRYQLNGQIYGGARGPTDKQKGQWIAEMAVKAQYTQESALGFRVISFPMKYFHEGQFGRTTISPSKRTSCRLVEATARSSLTLLRYICATGGGNIL
jgi:hypothetical protein